MLRRALKIQKMFNPEYIKKSSENYKKNRSEKHIFGDVMVYIKDPLPDSVDLDRVIEKIERTIPRKFLFNVDVVYIGDFSSFHKDGRDFNARYESGALYVSNIQIDEKDMIDDIVHEIAHAVEEMAGEEIYGDSKVEIEFLGKRKRLENILKNENYDVSQQNFLNVQYSQEFDMLLYRDIGYEKLTFLSMGLFISPYAATSLREYFARGFEEYYLGDRKYLTNTSPVLYNKIEYLDNIK